MLYPCLCVRQALFEACVEAGDAAMVAEQEEFEGLRAAALWWLNTHPQVWNSPAELLQAPHLHTCVGEQPGHLKMFYKLPASSV